MQFLVCVFNLPEERSVSVTVWSFQPSPKLERSEVGPKAIGSSSSFTASMCDAATSVPFSFRLISATANPASVPAANRRVLPELLQFTSTYCGGGGVFRRGGDDDGDGCWAIKIQFNGEPEALKSKLIFYDRICSFAERERTHPTSSTIWILNGPSIIIGHWHPHIAVKTL